MESYSHIIGTAHGDGSLVQAALQQENRPRVLHGK